MVRVLLILCLGLPGIATAMQEKALYKVELLCFSQAQISSDQEYWTENLAPLKADGALRLQYPAISLTDVPGAIAQAHKGLPVLNRAALAMQRQAQTLARDPRFRVVAHTGFIQPLLSNRRSQAVYLVEGRELRSIESEEEHLSREIQAVVSIKPIHTIYHVKLKMLYTSPDPNAAAQQYRLSRDIRLKLREPYYVDHPQFGVLMRIDALN